MGDANHTKPRKRVLVVGEYADDDEVRRLWTAEATRHGCKLTTMTLPQYAGLSSDDSVALVNLGRNLTEMLEEAVSPDGDKVLYFPPGGTALAARTLIGYCQSNRVLDAITGNFTAPEVAALRMSLFRRRIARLLANEELYDPILHASVIRRRDKCFIATTFEEEDSSVFEEGVTAAMTALGIEVRNPRNEYQIGKKISDKVREMIAGVTIVIANIRETGGRHNPNVFYEVGFSEAQQKIVIPCRHVTDRLLTPIDIRDTEYLEYENSHDLALQLYWGLLSKVTDGDRP
jgi:hypothetical protein